MITNIYMSYDYIYEPIFYTGLNSYYVQRFFQQPPPTAYSYTALHSVALKGSGVEQRIKCSSHDLFISSSKTVKSILQKPRGS